MSEAEVKALRKAIKKDIDNADEKTLRIFHEILQIENEKDWWDKLPAEIKKGIENGIEQADKGQVISHQEFLKLNKKWLKK